MCNSGLRFYILKYYLELFLESKILNIFLGEYGHRVRSLFHCFAHDAIGVFQRLLIGDDCDGVI